MGFFNRALAKAMSRVWGMQFKNVNSVGTGSRYFTDYESYLLAVKRIDWVYSCTSLIAYTIASNPWKLYKRGTDEVIESHPFIDLKRNPNPYQTEFEFDEEGVYHLELTGNDFIGLEGVNSKGQPESMYNLRPSRVEITPSPTERVAGYLFNVDNKKIPFDANEMLHIKYANPNDEMYGLGVIEAGENTFNTELNQQLTQLSFFINRAQPSGVLSFKEFFPDDDTFELVKKRWYETHGGDGTGSSNKRFRTAFLEGGGEYQQIQLSPADVGMSQLSKDSRDRILAMFGVPQSKLGIRETAEVKDDREDRFYYKETATPKLIRRQSAWNKWLILVGWGDVEMRYDLVSFDDTAARLENANAMVTTYSFTRDEIRAAVGKPGINGPEGQSIPMPLNIDSLPVDVLEKSIEVTGSKSAKPNVVKAVLRHRRATDKKMMQTFTPKLKEHFAGQAERVKSALLKFDGRKGAIKIDAVFSTADENERLMKLMKPLYATVAKEVTSFLKQTYAPDGPASKAIDPGWKFPNLDRFTARMAKQVTRVDDTTKQAITDELKTGFDRGYSVYQMSNGYEQEGYKGIAGVFDEAEGYRAELIARTESALAYNNATLDTYKENDIQVEVMDNLTGFDDAECVAVDEAGPVSYDEAQALIDDEHPMGTRTLVGSFGEES